MIISFKTDGTARMIYTEKFDTDFLGKTTIKRASYVEPNDNGMWTADLAPSGGPILGPFKKRSEAIEAELKWLEEHL